MDESKLKKHKSINHSMTSDTKSVDSEATPAQTTSNHNKQKMLETGKELRKALQSWESLTQTCQGPSADEQMLIEVQTLLKELKNQLKDFES